MIEKCEELLLLIISHIISKRNDSANIIVLYTVHDLVSVLFNLSPLGTASIIKLLVK